MLLSQRNRGDSAYSQGCGGRNCVCCDHSPKWNRKVRRAIRRVEKAKWQKEVSA